LGVLGLRVSLWTLVAESKARMLGAPGIVPGTVSSVLGTVSSDRKNEALHATVWALHARLGRFELGSFWVAGESADLGCRVSARDAGLTLHCP
jgi:hypothetical protein